MPYEYFNKSQPIETFRPVSNIDESGFSKDYKLLARLMQSESIICVLNHDRPEDLDEGEIPVRVVASTKYLPGDRVYSVSHPGTAYIWEKSEDEFCNCCRKRDLSFVVPPSVKSQ